MFLEPAIGCATYGLYIICSTSHGMKALVLGGAGDMGSQIVRFLVEGGVFEEVHIGDINTLRGQALASEMGTACRFVKVDAADRDGLVSVLKGYDVAVSALGPFYEFGQLVANAAVEAGVSLVDICDDYDAAKAILALHEEARYRGVTIITGIGWTPGISNLMAKYAYKRLGRARAVKVCWAGSAADSKGLAVIMHLLYAITGSVPMYIGGEHVLVNAGDGEERVNLPPPIGDVSVSYTGHPEPVTLPLYLMGLSSVEVKGGLIPQWQNSLGKLFVKLGLTSTPSKRRRLSKILHSIEGIFRVGGVGCSAVRVDVSSDNDAITLAAVDRMGRLTGLPASLCAELLVKGEVRVSGCYAPEGCLEPEPILEELAARGIKLYVLRGGSWSELKVLD